MMALLACPSFHDGRGSVCGCAAADQLNASDANSANANLFTDISLSPMDGAFQVDE